ncbi:MAG: type II toxin-antitoxin system RelE/ParE family toxin [Candidatus Hydrogenedentes bacterium]|nr:type II toxin-antitoxin system RelE/ParE family toxin [Candidatus Hydrogenedentota bacterium]
MIITTNWCRDWGNQFRDEFVTALHRMVDFPQAWQKLSKRTRRCRLERFPYGIVYQCRPDELLIVAIMHLKQAPGYWVDRL